MWWEVLRLNPGTGMVTWLVAGKGSDPFSRCARRIGSEEHLTALVLPVLASAAWLTALTRSDPRSVNVGVRCRRTSAWCLSAEDVASSEPGNPNQDDADQHGDVEAERDRIRVVCQDSGLGVDEDVRDDEGPDRTKAP